MGQITERFEVKEIIVSASNVHIFEGMRTARPLDLMRVERIRRNLLNGIHFETALSVNAIDRNRYRLIDGHHRMEAIRRFVREDGGSIKITFHLYRGLSDKEERAIFVLVNTVRAPSLADFVHVNQKDIRILQWMWEKFPTRVFIYGPKKSETGIRFLALTKAYLARTLVGTGTGASNPDALLSRIKALTHEDYDSLYSFVSDIMAVFGEPKPRNQIFTHMPLSALMKSYYCNLSNLGREEIRRRWSKITEDEVIQSLLRGMSAVQFNSFQQLIISAMNGGRTTKLAISPREYMEIKRKEPRSS